MCASDATRASRHTRGSTITTGTRSAAITMRAVLCLRSPNHTRTLRPRRLTWGCHLVGVARLLSRRHSFRRGRHRRRSRYNATRASPTRPITIQPINNRHINSRLNHNTLTEQPLEPFTDRVCLVQHYHHRAHKPPQANLGTDLSGQLDLHPGRGRQRQVHQARHRPHLILTDTLRRISTIA